MKKTKSRVLAQQNQNLNIFVINKQTSNRSLPDPIPELFCFVFSHKVPVQLQNEQCLNIFQRRDWEIVKKEEDIAGGGGGGPWAIEGPPVGSRGNASVGVGGNAPHPEALKKKKKSLKMPFWRY